MKRLTFSRLQKTILVLAQSNSGKVTHSAVKASYYGFPLRPKGRRGKLLFSRAEIGRDRYNNAAVAICRAFSHLERKGMAIRTLAGIDLTSKGRETAVTIIFPASVREAEDK